MAAKSHLTKKEKEQLSFFYGDKFSFREICSSKRNLHTLIVIGQPSIVSLDGISELINLHELWVVECQVKVMVIKIFIKFQIWQKSLKNIFYLGDSEFGGMQKSGKTLLVFKSD